MKRKLPVLVLIPCILVFAWGCASQAGESSESWKTYTFRRHNFSCTMPAQPDYSKQNVESLAGTITVHSWMVEYGDMALGVMVDDMPGEIEDIEKALDDGRDGAVRSSGGSLICEKKVSLAGSAGREITIRTGQDMTYTARIYIAGRTIYQVMFVAPAELSTEEVRVRFMDSFKLL